MAITKLSNIGTPQGGGAAHLKNCISYILNSDKTEGLVGGNAGTTPQEVYQVMMDTKQEWEKEMEGKAIISLSHFHREKRQKKKHML